MAQSAQQNFPPAQQNVGIRYIKMKEYIKAYVWETIAKSNNHQYNEILSKLDMGLSSKQRNAGRELAEKLKKRYKKPKYPFIQM